MISRITLENVSKQFGSKVAVDRVTFAIPGGFVFGLLGAPTARARRRSSAC